MTFWISCQTKEVDLQNPNRVFYVWYVEAKEGKNYGEEEFEARSGGGGGGTSKPRRREGKMRRREVQAKPIQMGREDCSWGAKDG